MIQNASMIFCGKFGVAKSGRNTGEKSSVAFDLNDIAFCVLKTGGMRDDLLDANLDQHKINRLDNDSVWRHQRDDE